MREVISAYSPRSEESFSAVEQEILQENQNRDRWEIPRKYARDIVLGAMIGATSFGLHAYVDSNLISLINTQVFHNPPIDPGAIKAFAEAAAILGAVVGGEIADDLAGDYKKLRYV